MCLNLKDKEPRIAVLNSSSIKSVAIMIVAFLMGERLHIKVGKKTFEGILIGHAKDNTCSLVFDPIAANPEHKTVPMASITKLGFIRSNKPTEWIEFIHRASED